MSSAPWALDLWQHSACIPGLILYVYCPNFSSLISSSPRKEPCLWSYCTPAPLGTISYTKWLKPLLFIPKLKERSKRKADPQRDKAVGCLNLGLLLTGRAELTELSLAGIKGRMTLPASLALPPSPDHPIHSSRASLFHTRWEILKNSLSKRTEH